MKIIKLPWLKPFMDLFINDWRAITIYHWVLCDSDLSPDLIAHEQVHVNQWTQYKFTFPFRYAYSSIKARRAGKHWYWANEFEIEARVLSQA